jgi:hypothetical protein
MDGFIVMGKAVRSWHACSMAESVNLSEALVAGVY